MKHLIPSMLFASIIAIFDLVIEVEEEDKFVKYLQNDIISANLVITGIAGAIGILVYSFFEQYLDIQRSRKPIVESIGVLIATLCIVVGYRVYRQRQTDTKLIKSN